MGPQPKGASVCEGPILGQQLQRPVAIGQVGAVGGGQDRDAGLAIGQGCLDLLNSQGRGQLLQMATGGAGLDQGPEFLQGGQGLPPGLLLVPEGRRAAAGLGQSLGQRQKPCPKRFASGSAKDRPRDSAKGHLQDGAHDARLRLDRLRDLPSSCLHPALHRPHCAGRRRRLNLFQRRAKDCEA